MDWNSSVKYKPSFDTGDFISRDKYPGIEKDTGINWGDAFNTKLPSSLTDTKPKNNWGEIFGGLFDKAKNTDKYRDESQRPSFGEATRGSGGQLLENLSALYPSQHAPMFIPGQTSEGIGGAIGGAIGTIGGALIGGPAGAAIGGKIGGGIGSFF
jgi:hypothetical protein